jgi:hypothetical protein
MSNYNLMGVRDASLSCPLLMFSGRDTSEGVLRLS